MSETQPSLNVTEISWRKSLFFLFQLFVSIAALGYIYVRIKEEELELGSLVGQLEGTDFLLLLLCIGFIPVNWGLEAYKWKFVLRNIYPDFGFWQAFKSVLAGISTGIFTPNRVGDYAGRILHLSPGKRWEAAMLLFVDRLCQLLVTLWVGIYCFIYLLFSEPFKIEAILGLDHQTRSIILIVLVLASLCLSLLLLFIKHIPIPAFLGKKFKLQVKKMQTARAQLAPRAFLFLLLLGFLRYLSYSFQYLLLMWMFAYEGSLSLAFLMIGLIFLIKSIIPYLSFTELGLRESIAIFIMGLWGLSASLALSSTFLLYCLNLILPAMLGLLFLKIKR